MPWGDGTGPWGFGPGYWRGYRRGFGWRGYGWRCQRFPWLPRWWWAEEPTVKEEKEILEEEIKALREDLRSQASGTQD